MTKADTVNKTAAATGHEAKDVNVIVDTFLRTVREAAAAGHDVTIRGFGTFGLKVRKQKIGRNIKAGTPVVVPEHTIVFFKPSKEYKAKQKV